MEIKQEFANVTQWLDMLRTAEQPEPHTPQTSRGGQKKSWSGTDSFEEALDLCERGWQEGLNRVEELSVRLSEQIVKTLYVPEVHFDVVGDQLDMGRFVNDEPEDFMTLVPAEIELEPRILHIVVNTFLSAGVSKEALFHKGSAICALTEALERHGKRVILDTVCAASGYGGGYSRTWVRVKDADGPVQLANLVFLLAHVSTFRRLIFGTWELLPIEQREAIGANGGYYGSPGELRPDEEKGDIYIGCASYSNQAFRDERSTEQWVISELSKQGIHVEREE